MKQLNKIIKGVLMGSLLSGTALSVLADANLTQLSPRGLNPITFAKFNPDVKDQIVGFSYGYTDAYVSSDNGKKWKRILNVPDLFPGEETYHSVKRFQVGPGKDMAFFTANADDSFREGLFRVDMRTGEQTHIPLPNIDLNAWIESFHVQDEEGQVIILHTGFRGDMLTNFSQVHYTKDGGKTWKLIYSNWENEYVHPHMVATDPVNPSRLYIMRNPGPRGLYGGLLISDDEGDTWREKLTGYTLGPLAFNPKDPKEMYLGTHNLAPEEKLFHSVDGGETWETIDLPYTPFIANNFTDIAFDHNDPNYVIALEENQVFVTADNFATVTDAAWGSLMFPTTVSINPFDPDDVIVGIDMDGLVRSSDRLQSIKSVQTLGDYDCRSIAVSAGTVYFLREPKLMSPGKGNISGNYASYAKLIGDPSDPSYVFGLTEDGELKRIKNDGSATSVMDGITDAGEIVTISGRYFILVGNALYEFPLDDSGSVTKIADNVSGIASNGSAIVTVSGSTVKKYDGSAWTTLPAPAGNVTMVSVANDGTVAAAGPNDLYVYKTNAWRKVSVPSGMNQIALSPYDSDFIVARKEIGDRLVAYMFSTDGGSTWKERDEYDFELCHAGEAAVNFSADGYCDIYLPSNDMGALSYKLDPGYQAPEVGPKPAQITEVRNLKAEINTDGSCLLTWISPETHYSATYDVKRDGTTIASGLKERKLMDSNLSTGSHVWTVISRYDDITTDGATVDGQYTGLRSPVDNLQVTSDYLINGQATIKLTWDAPAGYDAGLYTVTRDGKTVCEGTAANSFEDRDLSGGVHTWSVSALYNGTESEKKEVSYNVINNCSPVRNLDAWFDLDAKEVNLSWDTPGDLPTNWLSYCNEPASSYKPVTEDNYRFQVATYWSAEDLERLGLIGASLTDITFVPGTDRASYALYVWAGGDDDNPGDIVANHNRNFKINEWNIWTLPSPLEIVEGKGVWIGYTVTYPMTQAPVGVDGGSRVPGRNKINPEASVHGGWMNLEDYDKNADFNFCIGGRFISADGEGLDLLPERVRDKENVSYEVYRDGELVGTTKENEFAEGNLPERIYSYDVKAIHPEKGEAPAVTVSLFGGNLCPMPSDITMVAEQSTVNISWEAAAPELVPETLFTETFLEKETIPEDWILADKDEDGLNWGLITWDGSDYFLISDMYNYTDHGVDILSPDNWLILPPMEITGRNAKLTYQLSSPSMWENESYCEMLISTTGTDYDDFELMDGFRITNFDNVWFKRVIDLSAYSGQVRIAFRHKNTPDENTMGVYLDNIQLTQEFEKARLYNVYRDGLLIAEKVSDMNVTDTDVAPGTHTWTITTICDEYLCESNPLSVTAVVEDSGILDFKVEKSTVFYNPLVESIFVYDPEAAGQDVTVWDSAGRQIASGRADAKGHAVIPVSGLTSGVVVVKAGNRSYKLVIR